MENVKSEPKVSVVIPTYNRASLLGKALESVLSQTFQDLEIIVVDDGSTDETPKILNDWRKREPRLVVLRNEKNLGQRFNFPKVLNRGLKITRGKYVARLDDDDTWEDRTKLAEQVAFLESHPDHVAVGTRMIVVDEAGKEVYRFLPRESDPEIREAALFSKPIAHPTAVFRRDTAIGAGLYDENFPFAEDWDLWLRLGKIGKLANLPLYGTRFSFSGKNQSLRFQFPQSLSVIKIIRRHRRAYPHFPKALLFNLGRLLYSLLPFHLKTRIQPLLAAFEMQVLPDRKR